jgi:hypothetical protein
VPSEVQILYQSLLKQGRTAKDAAKEAQKRTGFALVTDKPIKPKGLKFSKRGTTYGQNVQLKSRPGAKTQQNVPSQFG